VPGLVFIVPVLVCIVPVLVFSVPGLVCIVPVLVFIVPGLVFSVKSLSMLVYSILCHGIFKSTLYGELIGNDLRVL
jgi:hypothetical protein